MTTRYTAAEKGKGLASEATCPGKTRVRVPAFDSSGLIQQHRLTVMGRVTNQHHQKIWALLPFLSDLWKTQTRAIGTDLGQGKFSFQLNSEEDLQLVLTNMPYHFGKWMIIIQRWEPTSDPNFPSLIPFWVSVQGIPLHLWSDETIRSIGNAMGKIEDTEITTSSMRMRVIIDGMRPLIMASVLEFDNGEEVEAMLVYEMLEKYCTICFKLDHEDRDCQAYKPTRDMRRSLNNQDNPSVNVGYSHNNSHFLNGGRNSSRNMEKRRVRDHGGARSFYEARRNVGHYGTQTSRHLKEPTKHSGWAERQRSRIIQSSHQHNILNERQTAHQNNQRDRRSTSHAHRMIWREIKRLKMITPISETGGALPTQEGPPEG